MSKVTKRESSHPEGESQSTDVVRFPTAESARSVLDELVRQGAQRMLQAAIDAEVEEFLLTHDGRRDGRGNRQVVRNGHLPPRKIVTGAGALAQLPQLLT